MLGGKYVAISGNNFISLNLCIASQTVGQNLQSLILKMCAYYDWVEGMSCMVGETCRLVPMKLFEYTTSIQNHPLKYS